MNVAQFPTFVDATPPVSTLWDHSSVSVEKDSRLAEEDDAKVTLIMEGFEFALVYLLTASGTLISAIRKYKTLAVFKKKNSFTYTA